MEQQDLIESIENPSSNATDALKNSDFKQESFNVNPLPEDLGLGKKKRSINENIQLFSYIILIGVVIFVIILFILGLIR